MKLSLLRFRVSRAIHNMTLPECFQAATVAAAAKASRRKTVSEKASYRRLNDKVEALSRR